MKKRQFICAFLSFIFLVINSSVAPAFQTAVATENKIAVSNAAADETGKIKEEQIAKLVQQLELLSRDTQSFNLFSNRVYFSVLTALDLYSAAQLADEYNEKKKTENYKPIAEPYKTYLYQVVNQQKAALDGAIDAAISEQNKFVLQAKNADPENGDKPEVVVPDDAKTIFDLAGINSNSTDAENAGEINNQLYLLVYLKSFTSYSISETDAELAFDFYDHEPVTAVDPQMQMYITSDLAEKRASFANKLFEKEPEKAIAKLTNLKEKPISFLTSEALAAFYKKDPRKAAQFAQKILDESFAGLNTEDNNILYQKMSVYLYFLSYLKDGKLVSRNNPLITKNQALKIVDLLVNFYTSQDSADSGGNEFLYIADIISDYSPEKANFLLQASDYQIKPKKKKNPEDNKVPFTYDSPVENPPNNDNSGGFTIDKPETPPPPSATSPETANNKPAPERINQYYTQALQTSNYKVSDVVFVNNLIKVSKVFNNWGEFEKAQGILNLARNIIAKEPTASSDYVLRLNLAQAYIDSKNTPEAVKITENALGFFEYFIQGIVTTSRYNRDSTDNFVDDGYELGVSQNSYYAYYLQSLVSSNSDLFNALMDENPEVAVNLSNKFTRKESRYIFKYYVLDGYLKRLQILNKQ